MANVLTVAGVESYYGELQALFGVDVYVEQGETVAIIGANGAGKTTLLRTITGVMAPKRGEVRLHGSPINGLAAYLVARRGVAMVPEGRKIFSSLSVEENLRIGAYGGRKGPWNIEAIYHLFPILQERARFPGIDLSGGQQQMLAIGRALMSNPELLLMDEISLGLAPKVVKDLYGVVRTIAQQGTTVIVVEQDTSRSMEVADRVYCLLEGRVSLHGKPSELAQAEIARAYFGV